MKKAMILAAMASAACAPHRVEPADLSGYDASPKLISCETATPVDANAKGGKRTYPVRLSFMVMKDGRVAPGSIRPVPVRGKVPTPEEVDEASRLARSCTFDPAQQGMDVVEAPFAYTFRILSVGK